MAGGIRAVLSGKEDCRTAESYGSGMLPTHIKRNTPMKGPAQESGPPGHPDDDFRACHSAGTPPAAYLTSYQSIHGIVR